MSNTIAFPPKSMDRLHKHELHRRAQLPPEQIQAEVLKCLRETGVPRLFEETTFSTLNSELYPEAYSIAQQYAAEGVYAGKPGLLLIGRPGNGKTSLAVAILRAFIEESYGYQGGSFWNVPRGLADLRASFNANRTADADPLQTVARYPLVILDDLGKGRITEWVADQFFILIDELWSQEKRVVITTNLSPNAFGELDEALVSRIMGMCYVVHIDAPDFRIAKD